MPQISGLNNRYVSTKSQKFRRIVPIKRYMIDKIDNNQNIKRLCRYMTTTPLLNRGKTYNGKMIAQPDLIESLKFDAENEKGEAIISKRVIYPHQFTEDVVDRDRVTIYVYSPRTTINLREVMVGRDHQDITGQHLFNISIVYPLEYEEIEPYAEERSMAIACEIADMLDDLFIEGETREIVGDIQFKIKGEILTQRLATSGYAITTIPIWTEMFTMRLHSSLIER